MSTVSVCLLASLSGNDANAAVGGPGALGWYTYADEADGAVYNYVDITATGTIVATGNATAGSVPLGAPFFFYDHTVEHIVINPNGFITTDLGSGGDISNDCGLPVNPSTGEGFRIYALHDDLTTDGYYEYFDAAAAAALGFPGETAGISVIQWVGVHDLNAGAVDFELILFHDDYSFQIQVAADADNGMTSTTGIQNELFTSGVEYACNGSMPINPGVTAVHFTLGPDSDCCSASAAGVGGCQSDPCQAAVCAVNVACCDTDWDAACAMIANDPATPVCNALCGSPPPVAINEIRIDQPGADNDSYFELVGPPGTPLDGLQYIVVGDVPTGEIEEITDLTGLVIPPDGHFFAAGAAFTLGPVPDLVTTLTFDNTDTNTHMLVSGLTAGLFGNLDANADGNLDYEPWAAALDTVANIDPLEVTILPYGPNNPTGGPSQCSAGLNCQELNDGIDTAMQLYRCPGTGTSVGNFLIGNDDPLAVPSTDTPGDLNVAPMGGCCGNGVIEGAEFCDGDGMGAGGETITCDTDCTDVSCGDGFTNATAGEECDDAVESALCNADCTFAACGDGFVNMAAGEGCDGDGMGAGGETAMCDADCSPATCGDGLVNMTAGEECDDTVETALCDGDCTAAMCGDGYVNVIAGEFCDGDGMGMGGETASCNDDCTVAMCGDGVVNMAAGEECDGDGMGMGGESATCNDDCTAAVCGDGIINTTAGETCDDGGRTDMCDDDCTAVSCGDGVVNMTAGEECDDGGDSESCDEDCTTAMCGDGYVNEAAGEDCDEMGETESCNDDCTAAVCGDGVVNATAGEECDDGNVDDGDGCASNCLEEASVDDTGTGGGSSGGGSGPGPSTLDGTGSGGDTDGDTDDTDTAGAIPGDEGCNCSTSAGGSGQGAPWSVLALLGFGALGRRRRRR